MTPRYDRDAPALRLSVAEFTALHGWAHGSGDDVESLASLRHAGVMHEDVIDPPLAPVAQALAHPVLRQHLVVRRPAQSALTVDVWITGDVGVLLLPLPDDAVDVIAVPPPAVPGFLARLTHLGPRQQVLPAPVTVATRDLSDLTSAESGTRARARPVDVEALDEALTGDDWAAWTLERAWVDQRGRHTGEAMHVLDSAQGLFVLEPGPDETLVVPVEAREVWRLLTATLSIT